MRNSRIAGGLAHQAGLAFRWRKEKTLRKNEIARLVRRNEYRRIKEESKQSDQIVGVTVFGKPFTNGHKKQFESGDKIALHESSHVVAAWMLGMPLYAVQFNDGGTEAEIVQLAAQTSVGIPFSEMVASSPGERYVFAFQHAFVTLAGVLGSSEEAFKLQNPLFEFEYRSHLEQAVAKLEGIAEMPRVRALEELNRLIPLVKRTFDDKRVQSVTRILANNLLKYRILPGAQAAGILSQAWPLIDTAYRKQEGCRLSTIAV